MKKILIIDDDNDILEALKFLLEDAGYSVQTTNDGNYIEELIDNSELLPNLIILDVLLSGMDGRNIARRLKDEKTTKHIPILMISAHPPAQNSLKEYGADDFLAKPFDIEQLLEKVAQHIS